MAAQHFTWKNDLMSKALEGQTTHNSSVKIQPWLTNVQAETFKTAVIFKVTSV